MDGTIFDPQNPSIYPSLIVPVYNENEESDVDKVEVYGDSENLMPIKSFENQNENENQNINNMKNENPDKIEDENDSEFKNSTINEYTKDALKSANLKIKTTERVRIDIYFDPIEINLSQVVIVGKI